MRSKLFTVSKYLLFLATGIGLIWYLFHTYYNPRFLQDLRNVKLFWLFQSVFAVFIAHIFRTLRWQLMIEPISGKKPHFFNVFNALMVGYVVNLALPRVGELARCAWLAKKENMNGLALIGTVIAERILDLLVLLVLLIFVVFIYKQQMFGLLEKINTDQVAASGAYKLLFILGIGVAIGILLLVLARKPSVSRTIRHLIVRIKDGFLSMSKIGRPQLLFLYTFLIWFFYVTSTFIAFKAVIQTADLTFLDGLLTVVAGAFGMVAPIQGGIGAFHFMVSECLILLGIPGTAALIFATVLHGSQTILVAILGLWSLLLSPKLSTK